MQHRAAMITSVTAIVVGCAAAVAVPLVYAARSSGGAASVPTFGAGAPISLAEQRPSTPVPSPAVPNAATSVPVAPAVTSTPVDVTISNIRITAPVVAVGTDGQGNIAIPKRVGTVGWYRFGPQLGASEGSIVLVGHVDSAQQGEGAFFRLHAVPAGSVVSVTGADHRLFRYRVIGRQQYPKTSVPLAALFTLSGAPHLTLITCGGSFNAAVRHYRDNVVITAVPIAASP